MSQEHCDENACEYCSRIPVSDYYGTHLYVDCIEMERNADWDLHEERKRKGIAEENEC